MRKTWEHLSCDVDTGGGGGGGGGQCPTTSLCAINKSESRFLSNVSV